MKTHIPEGNYLTKKQVAEQCGVIHQTVQQWFDKGWLPTIDIPGLGYIVNEADLIEFMKKDRPRGYPKGKPRK
jgi:excisionase family DNA binding protein